MYRHPRRADIIGSPGTKLKTVVNQALCKISSAHTVDCRALSPGPKHVVLRTDPDWRLHFHLVLDVKAASCVKDSAGHLIF